jgi:hypothetical protein
LGKICRQLKALWQANEGAEFVVSINVACLAEQNKKTCKKGEESSALQWPTPLALYISSCIMN